MKISYNQLTELTGFSFRTLKRRMDGLKPVGSSQTGANLWESKEALLLIYAKNKIHKSDEQPTNQLDLNDERARLAKEQADAQALKNKVIRGDLIPSSEITKTWGRIVTAAKMQFLALPDRLAQMLETAGTAEKRRTIIETEIKTILQNLADEKR